MAKTYNRLEIDVNKKPNSIITEVQGDSNSRYLDVSLFNNGVPLDLTGHEVKIFMVKPENGGEIWNDGGITDATTGRCEFLMTAEALSKVGHLQTQISVWKDNAEILSTQVFEIYVTKTLLGNSSVESSNEYGTLVVLFQNLYEAYALMTDMVSSFGKKGAVADARNVTTFWQGMEYLAKYMDTDLKGLLEKAIANSSVQGVLDLIGTSGDTGNSTLFGKLNNAENLKLLTPSNTVIKTLISSEMFIAGTVNNALTDGKRIKCLTGNMVGTVKITASMYTSTPYQASEVEVYRNDVLVKSLATFSTSYATVTGYIDLAEYDVLTFRVHNAGSGNTTINLLTISGTYISLNRDDTFTDIVQVG